MCCWSGVRLLSHQNITTPYLQFSGYFGNNSAHLLVLSVFVLVIKEQETFHLL